LSNLQHTLKRSANFSGISLHTGIRARLVLRPADEDTGFVLRRVDLPGKPEIPAIADNVVDVRRATTLAVGNAHVHTVEHVLAALYGMGVDNAYIELDGAEPPIADGSSEPFIQIIREAGTVPQTLTRTIAYIDQPVTVTQEETTIVLLPEENYRISCTVAFGPGFLTQFYSTEITQKSFVEELSAARTFCPDYEEIESLMEAGLIRGASLDNAMVLKDGAIISKDGLRFADECVRHKMLDIVGDLSLVGHRLRGHVVALKPGHPSNVALARNIREHMRVERA